MKLIDADELMKKIYSVKYLRKIKSKQLIDECERIDAIPIEWIKEYRRGLPEDEIGYQFDYMLDDWRKENEID